MHKLYLRRIIVNVMHKQATKGFTNSLAGEVFPLGQDFAF